MVEIVTKQYRHVPREIFCRRVAAGETPINIMRDLKVGNDDYACLYAKKKKVAARIVELKKEIDPKIQADIKITKETLINRFCEIESRCRQAVPVLDKDGNPVGEWKFDPRAATEANAQIGKLLGMYTEKQEIKHSFDLNSIREIFGVKVIK